MYCFFFEEGTAAPIKAPGAMGDVINWMNPFGVTQMPFMSAVMRTMSERIDNPQTFPGQLLVSVWKMGKEIAFKVFMVC